jgi:signal transduction histidine kinase
MGRHDRQIGPASVTPFEQHTPHERISGPKRSQPLECQLRQFLAAHESERHDLARTLHDDIGQLLAAMSMQLHLAKDSLQPDACQVLEDCLSITRQAIDRVRAMSADLYPSILDGLGLPEALRCHLDDQANQSGVAVHLLTSASWTRLPMEIEAACFRMAQQAVDRAIHHASATQVHVELRHDPEAVHLTIRDNGSEFDRSSLDSCKGRPPNSGLAALCQRIELLMGRWSIETLPEQGTLIRICVPVDIPPAFCGAQAAWQEGP